MAWQILAAGLAMASGLIVASTEAPPPHVDVVIGESDGHQRMTVPVTIRGSGPYNFLIDTGAQATVLSRDLADKLQLNDRRSAILVGSASRRPVETATFDGLVLGQRSINVPTAPVVDGENIGGADGVLGLDTLQDQRVLIDFKAKTIHVADGAQRGGNKGFEIIVKAHRKLGQLIITQARIDGVKVDVIVDTGAQGTTGNPALLRKLSGNRKVGTGEMTDINGISVTGTIRLARVLSVDRAQLRNVEVMFTDAPTFHALGLVDKPALILGMDQLRGFNRVAIDFSSQRILFDVPIEAAFETGTTLFRQAS